MKSSPAKNNTAERILDATQHLIQARGYNAFSFDDISRMVGIRKPSIMHHFAGKAELGVAVIQRYRKVYTEAFDQALSAPGVRAKKVLQFYFDVYIDFGDRDELICLCGSLAGEYSALPDVMQMEVSAFFIEHQRWLTRILQLGRKSGEFVFSEPPTQIATLFLDTLQGALMIKRATGEARHIHDIINTLKKIVVATSAR